MQKTKTKNKLRYYLKWAMWVLIVQIVLANISAAIYAYKFTHFYNPPVVVSGHRNLFEKTWKLFVGPRFHKNTEEEEPPFPYDSVRLTTSDNIAIDAWYSPVDTPKACVIFFHGLSVNKAALVHEAAWFRRSGYNVMLVDFRGHGKSQGNNSSLGVKETDEVEKACAYAKSQGNSRIILYGVSLGAGVCLKAVAENKVQPLAIVADMPFGNLHNHLKSRARVLGFPSEPFAALVTMWMGLEQGYNGFTHSVYDYAEKVKCPVLVEWGEKDVYVSRQEVEKVYSKLASSNKKFVDYPNADHESFLAVDPGQWMKEMESFLSALKL